MRPLALAAVAAWLVYAAVYALVFALAGSPIRFAVAGALANALPDALVACAAIVTSGRADRRRASTASIVRLHASVAVVVMILAAGGKALLLWFDIVVLNGQPYQIVSSIVAWHLFLSGVVYVAVASMSHAWLIARRLRQEEAHAARVEALRARAEMAALRAQLNPHFLFNTLHSVMGLVRRDPALAETGLEKLGDLLHYATRVHRDAVDWTSLRQEWEFARTYLDLESIRLGDRLQVVQRADDAAWDQRVPTFSIQPLVENAVRHGIAPRAAGGRISSDARLDRGHLRIDVSNDGDGHTTQAPDTGEGGLGLRVLRERLDTLYRGAAAVTAEETITGGYRVVLTLPLTDAEGEIHP
jgi:sensor histidine kinase YesM